MNITFLAKKGGVGKTTVSLLFYEALRQAGKSVSLNDWDSQGTLSKALAFIDGEQPEINRKADFVIYDTPPNLEHTATATAVRNADLVLVIATPSPADIWEAQEAVQFVQSRNDGARIRLLFNKFRKGTVLSRLIEKSAGEVTVPSLPVNLNYRECYIHALAQGWKALDSNAREEVLQFTVAMLSVNA